MNKQPESILIVLVTAANSEEAAKISEVLVKTHLVACATVIPAVQSIYWWEGGLSKDQESMILLKTTRSRYSELEKTIREMHSYKVPEILAVPVTEGSLDYMRWVKSETAGGGQDERR
jgi:periplasmic divalent cation tolerance protein